MPMTSDPEARKRSLAALEQSRTTWQPGQSGNPSGARTAGSSFKEHLNMLAGKDKAYLASVARDKLAPAVQRMAAKSLLRGLRDGYCKAVPLAANDLDRMADRTDGKPHQSLHVHRTEQRLPDAIGADIAVTLAALLTAGPEALAAAMAQMTPDARARAIALLPVDTTAEPIEPA